MAAEHHRRLIVERSRGSAMMPTMDESERTLTAEIARGKVPGLSAAVVAAAAVQLTSASGIADACTDSPLTADHAFLWFSMTKIVTATAALRLVDQHRLAAAGVDCAGAGAALVAAQRGHPEPAADALGAPRDRARAARPFTEYVRDEILAPLGMQETFVIGAAPLGTGHQRLPHGFGALLEIALPRGIVGPRAGPWITFEPFLVDGAAYGGLVGPVADAACVVLMHASGGALHGTRVLSEDAVGYAHDHGAGQAVRSRARLVPSAGGA